MNELLNQAFNKIDLVVEVLSPDVAGMDKKPLKDIVILASMCKDAGYLLDQYVLSKCKHEVLVPEQYERQNVTVQHCATCGTFRRRRVGSSPVRGLWLAGCGFHGDWYECCQGGDRGYGGGQGLSSGVSGWGAHGVCGGSGKNRTAHVFSVALSVQVGVGRQVDGCCFV